MNVTTKFILKQKTALKQNLKTNKKTAKKPPLFMLN